MQRNKQVAMGRKKFNMDPKKVLHIIYAISFIVFALHFVMVILNLTINEKCIFSRVFCSCFFAM